MTRRAPGAHCLGREAGVTHLHASTVAKHSRKLVSAVSHQEPRGGDLGK